MGPYTYHRIGRKGFELRHKLDITTLVGTLTAYWKRQQKTE
jgi:hypothetical protein